MTTRGDAPSRPNGAPPAERIDKWLWQARIFKTRSLAAKAVNDGSVRLTREGNTTRVEKASANVKPGDRLAFLLGNRLRVLEVLACGARRGPAAEARLLYADHSPPKEAVEPPIAPRDKGAGRPTKRDRRDIDRFSEPQ